MKKREEIIMIAQYLGFDSDYVIIGLAALVVHSDDSYDRQCRSDE